MSIEIKVPPLPESVSDATLVAWHKTVGEGVARDENLVDLETDKVVLEVPAPASGTLAKIVIEDGATVVAGDVLAILEEGEVTATSEAEPAQEKVEQKKAPAPKEAKGAAKTSPAVRRLLEEHDLDATMVMPRRVLRFADCLTSTIWMRPW
jgi:2-oxoglutarate dehydrogenase E2 component (dihydrolipoamide succinyltransferase)